MITEFAKMQRPFRQNCRNRIDFDKNFDKFEPFGQLPASSPADQSSQVHIDLDKIIQLGSIPWKFGSISGRLAGSPPAPG